jgi:putative ABC transport system permease protein
MNVHAADSFFIAALGSLLAFLLICTALGVSSFFGCRILIRKSQFAIRRAVGATRKDIVRHITIEGFVVISLGAAGGALLAFVVANWLSDRYRFPPLPASYVASSALLLWALGLVVTLLWARQAANTPPSNIPPSAESGLF